MPGPVGKSDEEKRKHLKPDSGKHGDKSLNVPMLAIEPKMPAFLDAEAKAHWKEVVPLLLKYRLLTELDGSTLGAMCAKYSQAVRAEKVLSTKGEKGGATFRSPNGHICQRPEVKIASDAWKAYYSYAEKFGMTPVARARMRIPLPKPANASKTKDSNGLFKPRTRV